MKSKTKKTGKKKTKTKIAPKRKTKNKVTKKKKSKAKKVVKRVTPIPEGASSLCAYLIVRDAGAAIDFYKKALGAKEKYRIEAPQGVVGHAELKIGDSIFMLAEENPATNMKGPLSLGGSPVGMHIYSKDVDKAAKIATDAGMKVLHPLENQFYGERMVKVQDPFGHFWTISSRIEHVTPKEMQKRVLALHGK